MIKNTGNGGTEIRCCPNPGRPQSKQGSAGDDSGDFAADDDGDDDDTDDSNDDGVDDDDDSSSGTSLCKYGKVGYC